MHYQGYFDASNKPGLTRCAFFIREKGGRVLHSGVLETRAKTSAQAEAQALFLLLTCVIDNIQKGSRVSIFGDASWVIDDVNRNRKYQNIFSQVKRDYKVTLKYIPRQMNQIADKMSKGEKVKFKVPPAKPKRTVTSAKKKYNKHNLRRENMCLDEIKVPDYLLKSHPNELKYKNKLDYFIQNGSIDSRIEVDEDGVLTDGYISYLILKDNGIEVYEVSVVRKEAVAETS